MVPVYGSNPWIKGGKRVSGRGSAIFIACIKAKKGFLPFAAHHLILKRPSFDGIITQNLEDTGTP